MGLLSFCCTTCASKQQNTLLNSVQQESQKETLVSKQSISKVLKEHEHLAVKERIALYKKLKAKHPDTYNFENEDEITMYGYRLLWTNKTQEALEIFKLIVEEFPNSANSYDSLGEAYYNLGNTEKSLLNYKKSLQINPDNFNAEDMIERILFPDKKTLTPTENFVKVYSPEEYKADLEQLGNTLLEVHPNALKFITKEQFWKTVEAKKSTITSTTTYGEFVWYCREIIANVNCSHTSNGNFSSEWDMIPANLKFPLEVRYLNNSLYVLDNTNNKESVKVKDEISSINGMPTSQLIQEIYIPSQGHIETYKKHQFNAWSPAMISYALGFPKQYTLQIKGKTEPILLNQQKNTPNFQEPFKRPCPENLCIEFIESSNTAVLTISTFNYYPWNNLDEFTQFINDSFSQIEAKKVKNLIIDLRYNGGGSPEASIHLLKHIVDKPFNYFTQSDYYTPNEVHIPFTNNYKNKLYCIIDGKGNSTTGHFMAIIEQLNRATIIGEELGSNKFCTGGQKVCRLGNTKMQFYVANSTSQVFAPSLSDERGIFPDYPISQSIYDYCNNIDTVKSFALNLILNQNN